MNTLSIIFGVLLLVGSLWMFKSVPEEKPEKKKADDADEKKIDHIKKLSKGLEKILRIILGLAFLGFGLWCIWSGIFSDPAKITSQTPGTSSFSQPQALTPPAQQTESWTLSYEGPRGHESFRAEVQRNGEVLVVTQFYDQYQSVYTGRLTPAGSYEGGWRENRENGFGSFQLRFAADGNSADGTFFTGRGTPYPLHLTRR
jgi:hypothetical protein